MKHEWRKAEKHLYLPGRKPVAVHVPKFTFLCLDGQGDPNDSDFSDAVAALYSIAYTIKTLPKQGLHIEGYVEHTVYPLESLWNLAAPRRQDAPLDKRSLNYRIMMRLPDFVNEDVFRTALELAAKKKGLASIAKLTMEEIEEGSCVQMLHIGSYDDEPASFALMEAFCSEHGLERVGLEHREIYLSDPRKTAADKLKTVLRYRVQ